MIKIKGIDVIEGNITLDYSKDKESIFRYWVQDLNTGLGALSRWVTLKGKQSYKVPCDHFFNPHCSGVRILVYDEEKVYDEVIFKYKELNQTYYFFTEDKECNYENWEFLLENTEIILNQNDVVYDLGANIGVYTMWALQNGVKQVYAFEPTNSCVKNLKKTFEENSNVEIFDKAISNERNIKTFYVFPHSVSNSLNYVSDEKVDVETINLEQFILENNLLPPTIIKCDIEGEEYNFLNSCSDDFISSWRGILLEYHLGDANKLWKIVSRFLGLGFTIRANSYPRILGEEENGMGTLIIERNDT